MGSFCAGILFARPSLLEGLARTIDMGGTLQEYNASPDGNSADALALYSDFRAVGEDLMFAMSAYREQADAGSDQMSLPLA